MKDLKEKILILFYEEHLQVKEIAKRKKITSSYVTQIIKEDKRYANEKEDRKNLNKIKRKDAQREYKKEIREQRRIDDNLSFLEAQHRQAVSELSKGKHLSNESFRKWNISAYHYNPSKHRYEYDSTLVRCYNIPKYIKERY